MKLLAVDIGNTDFKFALFEGDVLRRHWRIPGTRSPHADLELLLAATLGEVTEPLEALAYCSVVPDAETALLAMAESVLNLSAERITAIQPESTRLPLDMSLYPASQLGRDRLVNACGAALVWPDENLVVVDFGTATTLDLVSADGRFMGGAITPGLDTFANVLSRQTAKLPPIEIHGHAPVEAMGLDTQTCMEAGIFIGYRGLMHELLDTTERELKALNPQDVRFVATGGLAETALVACALEARFQAVDPLLTLQALNRLYRYNHTAGNLTA